jgi:hypothetical protein
MHASSAKFQTSKRGSEVSNFCVPICAYNSGAEWVEICHFY